MNSLTNKPLQQSALKELRVDVAKALNSAGYVLPSDASLSKVNEISSTFVVSFNQAVVTPKILAEHLVRITEAMTAQFAEDYSAKPVSDSQIKIDLTKAYDKRISEVFESAEGPLGKSTYVAISGKPDEQKEAEPQLQGNGISFHPAVSPLTDTMLNAAIAGMTLREFLSTHCEVIAKGDLHAIYATTAYGYFSLLDGNREVREVNVQALVKSYEKDGYLFTVLYMNEKLQQIDGQHRFESARRKQLPVYFMIMSGWGLKEVTTLNVNSHNWSIIDFMETYVRQGNEHYVLFKEFYDANEFDISTCLLLILGTRIVEGYVDGFKEGKFKTSFEQVDLAMKKANAISRLKDFHPNGWRSRNFTDAMIRFLALPGYNHDQMVEQLKLYPDVMLRDAKTLRIEEYIAVLHKKYNYRKIKNLLPMPVFKRK